MWQVKSFLILCPALFALSCRSLPPQGSPCSLGDVKTCLPPKVEKEFCKLLKQALGSRFTLCEGEAPEEGYLCRARLVVEDRRKYEPVLSEESAKEKAALIQAVAKAEADLRAALRGGLAADIELKRAALEKARLVLAKFKPKVVSWKEKILYRLELVFLRASDGSVAWQDVFYACGSGRPPDTPFALTEAFLEASDHLRKEIELALSGESPKRLIEEAKERFFKKEGP